MKIKYYKNDLPDGLDLGKVVAIDTEAMGLKPSRDRLCLIQLSSGDGVCHLVHMMPDGNYDAPNLKALLADETVVKLFHFARFDVALMKQYLGVMCKPVYCTKIASKLARPFVNRHGLKELCRSILKIEISKQEQSSDWGATTLNEDQLKYAATDVLYLHELKAHLDDVLKREDRMELAQKCFDFLPTRAELDLLDWTDNYIFDH
ncbi:MAG: ribonuclease D [Alphaproteobacteria bacterium]|jgi:ribonuclease D|nr:ribonuclease D [Alphaproteobacteria bacterium]MBT5389189.1 ribonuclease D [Alphaproteobacteria bacterium]